MDLLQDIEKYVLRNFGPENFDSALEILSLAELHDGQTPSHRLIRCALVASERSISDLLRNVELLAIDFRDVIVAGEYTTENGKLVQVRDLASPFSESAA